MLALARALPNATGVVRLATIASAASCPAVVTAEKDKDPSERREMSEEVIVVATKSSELKPYSVRLITC